MNNRRIICWFSCGAASAVATKITLQNNPDREIIVCYQDTGSEHEDNKRFLKECEEWFGVKINIMKSEKYKDIWDVFEQTKYLVGPGGARCTTELKRKVAENFIIWGENQDDEVFGYTNEEAHRLDRFRKNNPERRIVTPLIDKDLSKEDCLGMIQRVGIELPAMYKLGYKNNNCVGCVKGGAGYWNSIRKTHPEVFQRMAKVERDLGRTIVRRNGEGVYLDEMPEDMGNLNEEPSISCGLFCMYEADQLK